MSDDRVREVQRAAAARLGRLFDQIDAETRRPGEPTLRHAVAAEARDARAELDGQRPA